jgi:DNA-binding CsgD family transcriptional regulator
VTRDEHDRAAEARRAEVQRRVGKLTPRETEVFALVVTGLLNKQIGAALGIGEKSVKVHRPGHGEDARRIGRRAGSAGRRGRPDRTHDLIIPVPAPLALVGRETRCSSIEPWSNGLARRR